MNALKSLLGKQILFFDGGTGSVLQQKGLQPGEFPEKWNVSRPEEIIALHYNYFAAGSNIVNTNTFGAFSTKFEDGNPFSEKNKNTGNVKSTAMRIISGENADFSLKNIIHSAVANANEARTQYISDCKKRSVEPQPCFISFDIGSSGKLLKPMGDLDFEDAVNLFKQTFRYGFSENIDAVLIETMSDSYETKAAVIAAKEVREEVGKPELPILVSNAYDESAHLLTGASPETMVALLESLGVDALGLNCSLGPEQMKETVRRLTVVSSTPVIVKPNAGLPHEENGTTVFNVQPHEFVQSMKEIASSGAAILGGCCGTTPEYIALLSAALKDTPLKTVRPKNLTVVSSYTHTVQIGGEAVPVLIGERINPTGKKKFKDALRNGDIPYIIHQGLEQEAAGAHILDVNVGLPEINETEMMIRVLTELQSVTNLPLQIDTASPDVMEAALRRYNGKPLVNSVNGKQEVMDAIFPLVKKYGGVVVALTLDENGIPETSAGRIEIIRKIYANAARYGISKKDILIDALTMAVSSDTNAARATLETVRAVHDDFGGNTVLGVSNISFGLPCREFVTASFFTLAMHNGLSAAIMNPLSMEMMKTWRCFCLLAGKDKDCLNYIDFAQKFDGKKEAEKQKLLENAGKVAESPNQTENAAEKSRDSENKSTLRYAVIHGLKEDAAVFTQNLLESSVEAIEIIDGHLIPGLDYVGKRFEQKTMYLPQLLMAADAAKSAFSVIKAYLEKTGKKGGSKGTVIVATVRGDIHDIGKNIVKVLLENYDFTVIDLGKDVPPEKIVECCVKNHVKLVGLSALMTTTVPAMKETIVQLRKNAPWAKVCVGGAVMTQEYADSIGADFYGKDAMATVTFAQKLFSET